MKKLRLGLFVLFICLKAFSQTMSVVRFSEDPWPPYTYGHSGEMPIGGIAVDITREICKRSGIQADMQLFPWKRCLAQMKSGQRDALMLVTKNKERTNYLIYSDEIMSDRDLVWYNVASPFQWTTLKEMSGLIIGRTMGYNYGDEFIEAEQKFLLIIEEAGTDERNFKKLAHGRLDIFICNETAAKAVFKANPELRSKVAAADKPLKTVRFYMAFSKKSKARKHLAAINRAIAEMKRDGTLDAISKR